MKVTFLGTGTSQGVPVIACGCEVCSSADAKDKRLRTSLLLEEDGNVFAFDAGPDFRQQMLAAQVQQLTAIIFTHEHKDHTAGLDDVRAFNFKQRKAIDLYATDRVQFAIKKSYDYIFERQDYPGIPQVNLHTINTNPFDIYGVHFIPIEVIHYKLPVLGFRVKDFTYITDANYIAPDELEKIKGSKVLVLNALRREEHISHFTLDEALELIEYLKPEQAYLTHISHQMGLHNDVMEELPSNVALAYDGLTISV